ncbi:hypothetical protein CRYO30217_01570 [Parvicella tangerina]|uniref:Uncharacterized protein n=1 Tax=Parvicella tangerina TaxID=2829795 RepID=A0A916JMY2_9FLAO|nr:hypothetical protein CRYO30217_01570 [Parvicella tangerina]
MNEIDKKIRMVQTKLNLEQDPTKRRKLSGDLAILQAQRKVEELKKRNQ